MALLRPLAASIRRRQRPATDRASRSISSKCFLSLCCFLSHSSCHEGERGRGGEGERRRRRRRGRERASACEREKMKAVIGACSAATRRGLSSTSAADFREIEMTRALSPARPQRSRPRYSSTRAPEHQEHQGIRASGHQGIRASGHQGIRASGHQGIRASGHQGIRASGHQGIRAPEHQEHGSSAYLPIDESSSAAEGGTRNCTQRTKLQKVQKVQKAPRGLFDVADACHCHCQAPWMPNLLHIYS